MTQHNSTRNKMAQQQKHWKTHGGSAFFGHGALATDDFVYVFLCSRFRKILTRCNIYQYKSTWFNITQHESRWSNSKNIEKRMEGSAFFGNGALAKYDLVYVFLCSRFWKISTRYNINQDKSTWFNITQHESRWSNNKNIEKRMEGSAFFGHGALAKDDLVYVFLCSRFEKYQRATT